MCAVRRWIQGKIGIKLGENQKYLQMGYRFSNVPENGFKINCFANAAVNAILCIESLMQQLINAPGRNRVVNLLLRAYLEDRSDGHVPIHTSSAIRQLLYPANAQDDAEDMVSKIIENSFNIRSSVGRSILVTLAVKG